MCGAVPVGIIIKRAFVFGSHTSEEATARPLLEASIKAATIHFTSPGYSAKLLVVITEKHWRGFYWKATFLPRPALAGTACFCLCSTPRSREARLWRISGDWRMSSKRCSLSTKLSIKPKIVLIFKFKIVGRSQSSMGRSGGKCTISSNIF